VVWCLDERNWAGDGKSFGNPFRMRGAVTLVDDFRCISNTHALEKVFVFCRHQQKW
jgi:hypothetical protein